MKYNYDEEGVAFFYFALTILALILTPLTIKSVLEWLRGGRRQATGKYYESNCEAAQSKRKHLAKGSWSLSGRGLGLLGGWLIFAVILATVWNRTISYKAYNPFDILGVGEGADEEAITKAFKRLSKLYHPDKAREGEREKAEERFLDISKAYKALTDEKSRKNWEEYGNPDGPRGFSLGIALPAWLVDSQYSFLFLLIYVAGFMVGIPLLVRRFWRNWSLFTKDGIRHSTMAIFYQELREGCSPRRLLEIICLSHELRDLKGSVAAVHALAESLEKRERDEGEPFEPPKRLQNPEGLRAFGLLFAHLHRLPVVDPLLAEEQRRAVVKAAQLTMHGLFKIATARNWLQTSLNCLKLAQCLVAAVSDEHQSPLWQLPNLDGPLVRSLKIKQRPIKSIRELLEGLDDDKRRQALQRLTDAQYADLMGVAQGWPEARIQLVSFRILGQEAITTEGLITAQVKLRCLTAGESWDAKPVEAEEGAAGEVETFEFDEDGNLLDGAAKKKTETSVGLPIHCPHYMAEKRPAWWIFLTNRINTHMISPPVAVGDLAPGTTRTVNLQFPAPGRPGTVLLHVHAISDCMLGADTFIESQFAVVSAKDAAAVAGSPTSSDSWDISGDDSDSHGSPFE